MDKSKIKILVADNAGCRGAQDVLQREWYVVDCANNARTGLKLITERP